MFNEAINNPAGPLIGVLFKIGLNAITGTDVFTKEERIFLIARIGRILVIGLPGHIIILSAD